MVYGLQSLKASQPDSGNEAIVVMGRTLWWVDRNGNEERIPAPPKMYKTANISPDGTKVALTVGMNFLEDIWIWDFYRQNETRLTHNEQLDKLPIWTRDSQRIIFMSNRGDQSGLITGIFWKAANGT